ncbi:hypothetical protein [Rahnella sp. PCH160]|uniref:hypothetical protein n=1 Tax=Rahnella sp. PCH160 TaxID=3447928 RepID=UPI0039FDD5F5
MPLNLIMLLAAFRKLAELHSPWPLSESLPNEVFRDLWLETEKGNRAAASFRGNSFGT